MHAFRYASLMALFVCCIVYCTQISMCVCIFNEILQPSFLHEGDQQALSMLSARGPGLIDDGDKNLMFPTRG